jgi:hypothetical protein
MKEVGVLALLALLGPGFLWMGIRSLRTKAWHDGVPALESMIDRAIGEEPPPRTKWDRRFALFQTGAAILFGSFFTLLFFAVLYSLISE